MCLALKPLTSKNPSLMYQKYFLWACYIQNMMALQYFIDDALYLCASDHCQPPSLLQVVVSFLVSHQAICWCSWSFFWFCNHSYLTVLLANFLDMLFEEQSLQFRLATATNTSQPQSWTCIKENFCSCSVQVNWLAMRERNLPAKSAVHSICMVCSFLALESSLHLHGHLSFSFLSIQYWCYPSWSCQKLGFSQIFPLMVLILSVIFWSSLLFHCPLVFSLLQHHIYILLWTLPLGHGDKDHFSSECHHHSSHCPCDCSHNGQGVSCL